MREAIKVTKVYKASELSDKAKETARQEYAQAESEMGITSEMVTEDLQYALEDAGLPGLKLEWSLNYCQGDGVAFYGKVDLKALGEKEPHVARLAATLPEDTLVTIERTSLSNHYSHYNTMRVEVDPQSDGYEAQSGELREFLSGFVQGLSRRLEREGYQAIEGIESMESFLDAAETNDWEFTEDGKIYG